MSTQEFFEYRGVQDLFFAKIEKDDAEEYVAGTPKRLAYVKEVGNTVTQESVNVWYDNKILATIRSKASSEVTITCSGIGLDVEAEIMGAYYNAELGYKSDEKNETNYYALMYTYGQTNGKNRYMSFLKGTFQLGEKRAITEDDGTETVNQSLTFTPVTSVYNKCSVLEFEDNDKLDFSKFYEQVVTPENAATLKKAAE